MLDIAITAGVLFAFYKWQQILSRPLVKEQVDGWNDPRVDNEIDYEEKVDLVNNSYYYYYNMWDWDNARYDVDGYNIQYTDVPFKGNKSKILRLKGKKYYREDFSAENTI